MRRLSASLVAIAVVVSATEARAGTVAPRRTLGMAPPALVSGGTGEAGDFNGDGLSDLAIGIPGADGAAAGAGAVAILQGSSSGVTASRDQLWTENATGIPGSARPGDGFGSALAAGDFNGDGFADLAAGAPGDVVHGNQRAGSVIVLYGSSGGLRRANADRWTQESRGVTGEAARDTEFGSALAAGDFNGDGFADLAVGAPQQRVRGRLSAGSVTVLYGRASGLSARHDQAFTQASRGIAGSPGDLHLFGWSLAATDLGRGPAADLAVGTPLDSVRGIPNAGSVTVLFGSSRDRLRAGSSRRWTQNSFGVADRAQRGDLFGWALAGGNLGRSAVGDLAVGAPGEDLRRGSDAGAVTVLFGRAGGLSSAGTQFLTRRSPGILGRAKPGDAFGSSLAAGDLGHTAFHDLAVGVPGDNVHAVRNAGAVNVVYGSRGGLVARGNQLWTRSGPGLVGTSQPGEGFGSALVAAQFGRFGHADLAIGIAGHDVGTIRNAGAVAVLYGSAEGLRTGGNQLWTRASRGVAGVPRARDRFGRAVA